MILTKDEFSKIRTLQWTKREYGNVMYNTPTTTEQIQLFWHDFVYYIFADKFKNQNALNVISSFDNTQPVMLTDDLELKLPEDLETVIYYYYESKTPPYIFNTRISMYSCLVISVLIIIVLNVIHILVKPNSILYNIFHSKTI